jgi:hypothetical protein
MAEYLISYDLSGENTGERYAAIGAALRDMGARRVLFSQWVMVGASSTEVFNRVKHLFVQADRLLVSPYWGVAAHNLMA